MYASKICVRDWYWWEFGCRTTSFLLSTGSPRHWVWVDLGRLLRLWLYWWIICLWYYIPKEVILSDWCEKSSPESIVADALLWARHALSIIWLAFRVTFLLASLLTAADICCESTICFYRVVWVKYTMLLRTAYLEKWRLDWQLEKTSTSKMW